MKTELKMMAMLGLIGFVLSMSSLTANGSTMTWNGNISPSTVGGTLTTDLPKFDSSLGTLTGVDITLDLIVTPYAVIYNASGTSKTFLSTSWVSLSYTPADTWTVSHGSDSWTLAAPTVSTGLIYGSGQIVQPYTNLTLVGSNSAPVSLTASALSANLPGYVGTGTLSFEIDGSGYYLGSPGQSFFGGGGGNLAGTASVTYTYVPEPATICLLVLGSLSFLRRKNHA